MYKLPTFEECLEIVAKNECFTHRIRVVDGVKVSVFDYLLATYPDFKNPVKENPDLQAFELRGLCFTHNEDESVHRRYILLHKFFNLNQCDDYQYTDVKSKKITQVMDKMDGSVIRFIELPNGKVVSKSKTFFGNDQTEMADQVYSQSKELQSFVKDTLDNNLCAIFELTSPYNRIVLPYQKTQLTLLQLRDETTGEYLDIYSHPIVKKYNIPLVALADSTSLDSLIEQKSTKENIEGWIITFNDGQKIKLKTEWYCKKHGLLTEKLSLENSIMEMILDNTIDDALVELDQTDERKAVLESLCHQVNHFMLNELKNIQMIVASFNGDMKEFALAHKDNKYFPYASRLVRNPVNNNEDYILNQVRQNLKQKNYRLEQSRSWLKTNLNFELKVNSAINE